MKRLILASTLLILPLTSCETAFNSAKLTGTLTFDPVTKTFGVQVGKEPIPKAP